MSVTLAKIKCLNEDCTIGYFSPKRSDQKFCDEQCKNHYHNKQKKQDKQSTFSREQVLKHNHHVLEKLYRSGRYKDGIPEMILVHEGFEITVFTDQQTNEITGQRILWSHGYGVEVIGHEKPYLYNIHTR